MTTIVVESTEIETRSGDGYQVAEVNFPKRIVTVIAMPYERPTEVARARCHRGRERGAFDGIEKRTSQIRANRDHSWDKPVGKIVGLHPSRKEGLVAEVKISRTSSGRTRWSCATTTSSTPAPGSVCCAATTAASGTTPKCGNATAPSAG